MIHELGFVSPGVVVHAGFHPEAKLRAVATVFEINAIEAVMGIFGIEKMVTTTVLILFGVEVFVGLGLKKFM